MNEMSEDLLRKLRFLEEDYVGQLPAFQRVTLQEINQIRSQLGMPLVDFRLNEIADAVEEAGAKESKPEPEEVQDHTEAREVYQAYLKKIEELEVHRAYAKQMAKATEGANQTPVRPLATMGTDGGPLLCDHCGEPMVLEGGSFHGVTADAAWKKNPSKDWSSWILGGMIVEIQSNGTLRIYHGYPERDPNHCCTIAIRNDKQARAEFDANMHTEKKPMIRAFVEHEFPDMTTEERFDLLYKILDTMYKYDPGLGINRPRGVSKFSVSVLH